MNIVVGWQPNSLVLRSHPGRTLAQSNAFEDVLRLAGYQMPLSLREALVLGATHALSIRCLRLGFGIVTHEQLFDFFMHSRDEATAGVSRGGAWLPFSTEPHLRQSDLSPRANER